MKYGTVSVSCREVGEDRLRIEVTDTGLGLSPDEVKKLFTPFERLSAEKTGVEGTGLGLTLSHRLVNAMNGTMGLESVPGEGSTFYVELPLVESPEIANELPAITLAAKDEDQTEKSQHSAFHRGQPLQLPAH